MQNTNPLKDEVGSVTRGAVPAVLEAEFVAPEDVGAVGSGLVLRDALPRDGNPALVYLASLSEGSRRTMRGALEKIAALVSGGEADALALAWHGVRYQHAALIRAKLAETYAPATANKMLSALRGVLKECFRLGLITAEDYHRARDLPTVRGETLLRGRSLSRAELAMLFAACGEGGKRNRAARDAALLAVLYGCGLRRAEAVKLDSSDYDAETGDLKVRGAKGRKDRLVYASGGVAEALAQWTWLRGGEDGPLFYPINKSDRMQKRRMSDQSVYDILKRLGRQINAKGFSPHDMRRTFIGDLLDAGADLSVAQHLAGHASVQTTAKYDRRGERAKRKAASLLHVPYPGSRD